MDENPYESPAELETDSAPSTLQRFVRGALGIALRVVIVGAFIGHVAACVWLFNNGYAWPVVVFNTLAFMLFLQFEHRPWRKRLAVSLSVPLAVLGGWAGFHIFFWGMLSSSWFQAVFNDKGFGPLGLGMFVLGCAGVTGVVGGWSIHRVLRLLKT